MNAIGVRPTLTHALQMPNCISHHPKNRANILNVFWRSLFVSLIFTIMIIMYFSFIGFASEQFSVPYSVSVCVCVRDRFTSFSVARHSIVCRPESPLSHQSDPLANNRIFLKWPKSERRLIVSKMHQKCQMHCADTIQSVKNRLYL